MKRFYSKVIYHPVMITVIFVILTIFFGLCEPLIPVNYDMNDYLPDDSHSTVSLEIMEQEFDGGIPNCPGYDKKCFYSTGSLLQGKDRSC